MKDLIEIENTPAAIDVNFEAMKKHLQTELEQYRIVVTADTVAGAKKSATELNALKKEIDERRKKEVAKASEPVKKFDEKMKELVSMCDTGRQEILDQVKRFEDETRDKAKDLLLALRMELWNGQGVGDEFRRAEINDLIKLSAVTGKGNLSASARTQIEQRVQQDKSLQDRTRMRLVELENQSYKAGLSAPLTRDHVQHFLFADDETYTAELQRIMDAEIERQAIAERRAREKQERERQQAEEAEKAEKERQARIAAQRSAESAPETPQESPAQEPAASAPEPEKEQPAPREQGRPHRSGETMVSYEVVCTFNVTVPARATPEIVEMQLQDRMEEAGFQSLQSVRARRVDEKKASGF